MRASRLGFALAVAVSAIIVGQWSSVPSSVQPSLGTRVPTSSVVRVAAFFTDDGVLSLKSLGSGVVVTNDGFILTNSHVIRDRQGETCGCKDISEHYPRADFVVILCTVDSRRPPEPMYVAQIVEESRDLDVAVLKITHTIEFLSGREPTLASLMTAVPLHDPSGEPLFPGFKMLELTSVVGLELPAAALGNSSALRQGDPVTIRGYPLLPSDEQEVALFAVPGTVGQVREDEEFLWITGFSTFGSSGGAILEEKSDALVGVLCGKPDWQEHAGVPPTQARPVGAVMDLLPDNVLLLPVAAFEARPASPALGRWVRFDAKESTSKKGTIESYEWDFDDDGVFDETGIEVRWRFDALPSPRVTLRVTDSQGLHHSVTHVVPLHRSSGFDEESCTVRRGGAIVEERESIQDCIDCAQPGDTIVFPAGRYAAGLYIDKSVTLVTEGFAETGVRAVFEGDSSREAIRVEGASGAVISGLLVTNGLVGVAVVDSTDVVLEGCVIDGNLRYGVEFLDSSGLIDDCELIGTIEDPLDQGGSGLFVGGDATQAPLRVVESVLSGNRGAGITARGQRIESVGSRIAGNGRWGIDGDESAILSGRENIIEENRGFGVFIGNAAVELEGGTVRRTQTSGSGEHGDGLFVGDFGSVTIWGSRITNNDRAGIQVAAFEHSSSGVEAGMQNRVIDGLVEDNVYGVLCEGVGRIRLERTSVVGNDFTGIAAGGAASVRFDGGEVTGSLYRGIEISGSADLVIRDSRVSSNGDAALVMRDCAEAVAERVVFSRNCLSVSGSGSAALILEDQASLVVQSESAVVENAALGILAVDNASLLLADVAVASNAGAGLRLEQTASAELENVDVCSNRGIGVDLRQGASATISGCWLSDNAGVGVARSSSATVRGVGNVLTNNLKPAKEGAVPEGFMSDASVILWDSISVGVDPIDDLWDALRRVAPGGEIVLPPGVWDGGLVITKPVTIVGAGADQSVVSGSTWDGFRVLGEGHLTLESLAVIECEDVGIRFASNSVQTQSLRQCRIEGNGEGVLCTEESRVELDQCEILSNVCHGVWGLAHSTLVLRACRVEGNTLPNCAYSGNYDQEAQGAVEFGGDAYGLVIGNTIAENLNFGVEVVDRARVKLAGNMIQDNAAWGVIQIDAPCFEYPQPFEGLVEGSGNRIERNGYALDEEARLCGDGIGDVCPVDLGFLKREE